MKYTPVVFNGPEDLAQENNPDAAFVANNHGYLEYVGSFTQLVDELLLTRVNVQRFHAKKTGPSDTCGCLEDALLWTIADGYDGDWSNTVEATGKIRNDWFRSTPTHEVLLSAVLAKKLTKPSVFGVPPALVDSLWAYNDLVLRNQLERKLGFLDEVLASLRRAPKFESGSEVAKAA